MLAALPCPQCHGYFSGNRCELADPYHCYRNCRWAVEWDERLLSALALHNMHANCMQETARLACARHLLSRRPLRPQRCGHVPWRLVPLPGGLLGSRLHADQGIHQQLR